MNSDTLVQSYANENAKNLHRALAAEAALAELRAEVVGLRDEVKRLQSLADESGDNGPDATLSSSDDA